mmetsp:Transcript_99150/g.303142  ORF Transcript_99150/g.303142 Transcript_99150/m.303142 type:complete len:204 (-) Transcript_99150:179-790(-)
MARQVSPRSLASSSLPILVCGANSAASAHALAALRAASATRLAPASVRRRSSAWRKAAWTSASATSAATAGAAPLATAPAIAVAEGEFSSLPTMLKPTRCSKNVKCSANTAAAALAMHSACKALYAASLASLSGASFTRAAHASSSKWSFSSARNAPSFFRAWESATRCLCSKRSRLLSAPPSAASPSTLLASSLSRRCKRGS